MMNTIQDYTVHENDLVEQQESKDEQLVCNFPLQINVVAELKRNFPKLEIEAVYFAEDQTQCVFAAQKLK